MATKTAPKSKQVALLALQHSPRLKCPRDKKNPKEVPVNFKLSPADKRRIEEKARQFARGNVSFWIRYASMHFQPQAKELTVVQPVKK